MHLSQCGPATPGLQGQSPLLGSQKVTELKGRTADPTGWQEHTTAEKTREQQWVNRPSAETGPQLFPPTTQHISEAPPLLTQCMLSERKLIKLQLRRITRKAHLLLNHLIYHKSKGINMNGFLSGVTRMNKQRRQRRSSWWERKKNHECRVFWKPKLQGGGQHQLLNAVSASRWGAGMDHCTSQREVHWCPWQEQFQCNSE